MKHKWEEPDLVLSRRVTTVGFAIAIFTFAALLLGSVLADRALGQTPAVQVLNVTDTETGFTYYYNRVGTSVMVSKERSYVPYPQVQNYEGRDYFSRYVPDYSDPALRSGQWVLVPVGQYSHPWQAQDTPVRGLDRWGYVRPDQGGAYLPWVSPTGFSDGLGDLTPLRAIDPVVIDWLDE